MKIGVDCRLSGIAHAGIGRYIGNLIKYLPLLAPEIDWVYFYRDKNQIIPDLDVESRLVSVRHYTFQEQLQLISVFNQAKLDLLHVPHFNVPILYPGKLVVTIHDLLWHQQKGTQVTTLKPWEYWGKYTGYRLVASQAIKKANKIIVPTQAVKKTLSKYYPKSEEKVVVAHEGVDSGLLTFKDRKVKKKINSLIYVGSLYPHKNLKLVFQALQKLPTWKLTIVGSRNVFQDQIRKEVKKYQVQKQVKFTGYLPDKDLAQKIKTATALVQPSLSEGFGLTGIEAMALGTPVIASDIPVFKEIYQNAAVYFNPHSIENFIQTVNSLTSRKPTLNQMQNVAKQYSWQKMAEKTLQVYKSVL